MREPWALRPTLLSPETRVARPLPRRPEASGQKQQKGQCKDACACQVRIRNERRCELPNYVKYRLWLWTEWRETFQQEHYKRHSPLPSQLLAVRVAKGEHAKGGQDAEEDGDGLLEADGAGNGRAAEDDGGEEAQLDAVGLAILQAVATEAIWNAVSGGSV